MYKEALRKEHGQKKKKWMNAHIEHRIIVSCTDTEIRIQWQLPSY